MTVMFPCPRRGKKQKKSPCFRWGWTAGSLEHWRGAPHWETHRGRATVAQRFAPLHHRWKRGVTEVLSSPRKKRGTQDKFIHVPLVTGMLGVFVPPVSVVCGSAGAPPPEPATRHTPPFTCNSVALRSRCSGSAPPSPAAVWPPVAGGTANRSAPRAWPIAPCALHGRPAPFQCAPPLLALPHPPLRASRVTVTPMVGVPPASPPPRRARPRVPPPLPSPRPAAAVVRSPVHRSGRDAAPVPRRPFHPPPLRVDQQ